MWLDRKSQLLLMLLTVVNLAPHRETLPTLSLGLVLVGILTRLALLLGLAFDPPAWLAGLVLGLSLLATFTQLGFSSFPWAAGLLAGLAAFLWLRPPTLKHAMSLVVTLFGLLFLAIFEAGQENGAAISLIDLCLLTSFLYQMHYPEGSVQFLPRLLKSALKMAGAIVLGLLALISFFPRVSVNLFEVRTRASIGFGSGSEMSPGEIAELAISDRPAFRVRFINGFPSASSLYWRGTTLSLTDDGMHWFRTSEPVLPPPEGATTAPGAMAQEVLLEPRFERVLFALDTPVQIQPIGETTLFPIRVGGEAYVSRDVQENEILYRAISLDRPTAPELPTGALQAYLELPAPGRIGDPRLRHLAESLRTGAADGREIAGRLMSYFQGGFRYRLDPGEMARGTGLVDFLFVKREGFCGHFATSFATLMRMTGVPSRVVMGFHGGELNEFDGTFLVRDRDAHAWAEIWSARDHAWIRYDPTAVVAPLRLELGAGHYRDRMHELPEWLRALAHWNLAWDAVVTEWKFHRLGGVTSLFQGPKSRWQAWLLLFVVALLVIVPLAVWLKPRGKAGDHKRDELALLYERYCRVMDRLGVKKAPHEGPLAFLTRCEERLPGFAGLPREFVRRYVALRYAPHDGATIKDRELKRLLQAVERHARVIRPAA